MANSTMIGKIEGLDADANALLVQVKAAIAMAMPRIASTATEELRKHIEEDVYDQFDPVGLKEPKDYVRRKDSWGLTDFSEGDGIFSVDIDADGITLLYNPQGWSNQADPDWILDGNMLIERIEKAYPTYDWRGEVPGPRPFFTPFVTDMIEGGIAENELVAGMNAAKPKLEVVADDCSPGAYPVRHSDDWNG